GLQDRSVVSGIILVLCKSIVASVHTREVLCAQILTITCTCSLLRSHVLRCTAAEAMYGSVLPIPAWMECTANPRGPASGAFFLRRWGGLSLFLFPPIHVRRGPLAGRPPHRRPLGCQVPRPFAVLRPHHDTGSLPPPRSCGHTPSSFSTPTHPFRTKAHLN